MNVKFAPEISNLLLLLKQGSWSNQAAPWPAEGGSAWHLAWQGSFWHCFALAPAGQLLVLTDSVCSECCSPPSDYHDVGWHSEAQRCITWVAKPTLTVFFLEPVQPPEALVERRSNCSGEQLGIRS